MSSPPFRNTADPFAAEPFATTGTAPVAGGAMRFGQAGPPPEEADGVVLALHGVTSNLMAWRSVARAMGVGSPVSIIAPDLRGRADSVALPAPYGIAAHVADMAVLLDHLQVERVVLAGHSMGAYVAARLAAEHPERVSAVVLVDGGVSVAGLEEEAAAAVRAAVIGPSVVRHALTFATTNDYLSVWRAHPALSPAWNVDIEAFALHELGGTEHALRSVFNLDAVETDADEMLFDPVNRTPIERVGAPVHVLRAPLGAMGDRNPAIPQPALECFVAKHPAAMVEQVDGANHYTILMGDSPGPARVAAAIRAATQTGNFS
jgi:pimeloyl-ACP methyl ester carboxylesterase